MRAWTAGVVIILACLAALYFFGGAIARFAVIEIAQFVTSTKISARTFDLRTDHLSANDVVVRSTKDEPVATIAHLYVGYNLRDLLPGGQRLFGLRAIEVDDPHVTIIRRRDGTWNIPIPKNNAPSKPGGPPLWFTGSITDGSLALEDYTRVNPAAQRITADGFNAQMNVDTAARSTYTIGFDYVEDGRNYPVRGAADINPGAGFAVQHWSIAKLPIARLVNYASNTPSLTVVSGEIDGLDARMFALPNARGALDDRVAGSTYLRNMRVYMSGLLKPIRDIHGRLDAYRNGMLSNRLDASIAGIPVSVSGGVYNLTNPTLRVRVNGNAELAKVRTLLAAGANLPLSGSLQYGALAEGTLSQPLTLIAIDAPRVAYRGLPFSGTQALAAFDGKEADVLNFGVRYGTISVSARGRAVLHSEPNGIAMLARVDIPSGSIPYTASIVPGMPLRGTVLATASDPQHIETQGLLDGKNNAQNALGVFHVTANGVGTIGPFFIGNDRSSVYGRVQIDHPHGASIALIDAQNMRVRPVPAGSLPGLPHVALPAVEGVFNGHLVGGEDRGRYGLTGEVVARNVRAAGMTLRSADVPLAVFADGKHTIAQVHGAQIRGASAMGVSVGDLSATIAQSGNAYRVYAAHASVAGGDVLAAGTFGNGGRLALSASGLKLAGVHQAKLPLHVSSVDFGSQIAGSMQNPSADAAVVMNGDYRQIGVSGNAALSFANSNLDLHNATVGFGPAYLGLAGSVANVPLQTPSVPRLDMRVQARAIDIHELATLFQPRLAQDVAGTINADAHITGNARAPHVAGSFNIPQAMYHGLGFQDLGAQVSGGQSALAVNGGHVTFGSTTIAFGANLQPNALAVNLKAPNVDLSDFNDYFDTGDMLAGHGRLALAADLSGGAVTTNGNASFSGARFRSFDFGAANANWNTVGNTIHERLSVNGNLGTLQSVGSVAIPRVEGNNFAGALRGADVSIASNMHDLDVDTWMPLLGFNRMPVSGKLDADATVNGRYPNLSVAAHSNLREGTVAGVKIEQLIVALNANRESGHLTSAVLQLPNLNADASGTFGLTPAAPVALTAHVLSSDIGALAGEFSKTKYDIGGGLATTVRVNGTLARPQAVADVNIDSLRMAALTIPHVTAEIRGDQRNVALHNGEVDLNRGRVLASGNVPISMRPKFAIDPGEPISLSLTADDVELSNFMPMLPKGTNLAGRIDGHISAGGNIDSPTIAGTLALAGGSFSGPQERLPITNIVAQMVFHDRAIEVRNAGADVGGGTLSAAGNASVPSFRRFNDLSVSARARLDGAQIDAPSYYKGRIDADVSLTKSPGGPPTVGGRVALANARVPLNALFNPNAPKNPSAKPPDIAFQNFQIAIERDVRVQSGFVDVGATGDLSVNGTLAKPSLNGRIVSTGGTVSFYRTFRIQRGVIVFDPSSGIMPDINVVATTRVPDPVTDITLHVTGQAPDNMNVDFSSDPYYDRSQILGLLVGAQVFGAVAGVPQTGGSAPSASSAVQQLAAAQVNQVFTRHLLEPLSNSIGETLGFSNLQIYSDLGTGFGAEAERALGKNVSFFASSTFYYPRRFTYGVRAHPHRAMSLQLSAYSQQQVSTFGPPPQAFATVNNGVPAYEQMYQSGTNGIDFKVKREYPR